MSAKLARSVTLAKPLRVDGASRSHVWRDRSTDSPMYKIISHGQMAADTGRMDAYAEALRRHVGAGSVVVDIGTGIGIFALLASEYGARRVFAIESSDCIQLARDISAANGSARTIEFTQGLSTEAALPERADVIVSDLRGVLPMWGQHVPAIVDARERFLAENGVLIPRGDSLWVSIVSAEDVYRDYAAPWRDNDFGLDMTPGITLATSSWKKASISSEQLMVEPACWARLSYHDVESPDVSGGATWTVARAGTGHGLALWFDSVLAEGVEFSNAPGKPELIYGQAFFPWVEPVELAVGDAVSVQLQANLVGGDYVWSWETHVRERGDSSLVKAHFRQSTFHGAPLSPKKLRKQAEGYVPPGLSEDGRALQAILELMGSGRSVGEIAKEVSKRFPARYPTWKDAWTQVGALSRRYAE